ncbi:hypothetical protein [Agromyces mariniharenae]|uniref:Uncharacterized protein n=1 Tax=Agromyces mariniharenae TaxID=2604423 RepID=A0A5S4V1U6_9MICO|nr:hypothetical protein [Agromyces mariniharenae]TYL53114.1 hypothetical protein FYC51_05250 [Agromyces mariniharenae]
MGIEHEDPLERRREELRRIVYGTRDGAESAAATELAEIEAELAARASPAAPAMPAASVSTDRLVSPVSSGPRDSPRSTGTRTRDGGTDDVDDSDAAGDDDAPAADEGRTVATTAPPVAEEPPPRWRPTRTQVVVAAIAGFLLVATGIALVGPARDALSPPRGLGVFEHELLPDDLELADQVATGARLGPDEAATLRSLGRAFGYEFWVFRDDGRVCMLSRRLYFFDWERSCATLQEFQAHGLTRLIAADDIRNGARPRRVGPGDVVVVTWGPDSTEIDWTVEP